MKIEEISRQWLMAYGYSIQKVERFTNATNKHEYCEVSAKEKNVIKKYLFIQSPFMFDRSLEGEIPLPALAVLSSSFRKTEPRTIILINKRRTIAVIIPESVWKFLNYRESIGRYTFFTEDANFVDVPSKFQSSTCTEQAAC